MTRNHYTLFELFRLSSFTGLLWAVCLIAALAQPDTWPGAFYNQANVPLQGGVFINNGRLFSLEVLAIGNQFKGFFTNRNGIIEKQTE